MRIPFAMILVFLAGCATIPPAKREALLSIGYVVEGLQNDGQAAVCTSPEGDYLTRLKKKAAEIFVEVYCGMGDGYSIYPRVSPTRVSTPTTYVCAVFPPGLIKCESGSIF